MRMKTAYFLVLAALLVASNCFAAKVTNVELTYENGSTVARIDVSGTIRFTHQTEIAKDGKPFRVIVDVLSATHDLGAKSFMSLPRCAVLHIRSSQYSVKPESIVRLVFDMNAESVYQIDSDTKTIKLRFPDKSSKAFATWSTQDVVSSSVQQKSPKKVLAAVSTSAASAVSKSAKSLSKTAAQLNRSIEADRQASIASTKAPSSAAKEAKAKEKNSQLASNSAPQAKVPKNKIERPKVSKETLARASGSKSSYPPDQENAGFEPKKSVQNANVATAEKPSVEKGRVVADSKPVKRTHATHSEKSEKTAVKPHSSVAKSSPKISSPKTVPPTVSAKEIAAQLKGSKATGGPVLASNSDQPKAKQAVIRKATTKNTAASKKVSTEPMGGSKKVSDAAHSSSTPKSEPPVTGKPSIDSQKGSLAPKGSAKKPTGSKAKPNVSSKSSKAAKSSPVKPEPKKKKAVYASADKAKSSAADKSASKKVTKAKTSKKAANKQVKQKAKASSTKNSSGTKQQVVQKKDSGQRATSRFRRTRDQLNKIKGTMVAEFPKRLVIKYRGKSHRDPFETLVNERKTNNSLQERKVPNAEGLKLVGIIEAADGDNRALFEDTDGYGYIMKSGDKVRKGYVLRVEIDRVYFQIFEYGWSRTVALNLEEY